MNTVCPGFVPHHVKPNRCRRCFKDIHDHDSEVTTSFTLPLPRRRRESVAIAETPKSEEVEATFTVSEATSSGHRTRQRSSSTSSWFQEKKVDEEHKERIDTLFRNADDSRASYNSRREEDDQLDTVAVVRMPAVRRRQGEDIDVKGDPRSLLTRLSEVRKTNDVSAKPPELPPKTLDSFKLKKSDFLKKSDADSGKRLTDNGQRLPDSGHILDDSRPSWTRHGTELSGKSTDSRLDPVRRADAKVVDKGGDSQLSRGTLGKSQISSRSSDSRLDPVKKPDAPLEAKDADKRSGDGKFSGSRFGTGKSDLSSSSYLKSKFEPEAASKSEDSGKVSNEKPTDSKLDEKKTTSKFGEVKLKDTKFGEVKLRDTKVSELRSRASKFESTTSKTTKEPSKTVAEAKPAESKPEAKPAEFKPEPKPVLARFSSLRSVDTKTSPVAVAAKTADKNAASREPTRLGEEVSESSKDSETSKSKPSAVTEEQKPKPIDVRNSTVKDKPKAEISKAEEVQQTQGQQQQWESRVSELQSSVSQLRRRLEESEDACCMLEREKADLLKQQKDRLEQDRRALEKTANELAKMRAKLAEMQSSQDLARKTKQELKDAKEDLNRKEAEWNKKEADWKRKESELIKREPPETKLNVEQLKLELKDAKAELNRKEAEWSQKESELSKKEPATRQSVDQLKKDLREAKAELSRKEIEWNKKDIEWSKKESEWSKAKAELSKSDSGPMQNVEQLKQELKDAKAEWNKKEAEWNKKEAEWSKKEAEWSKKEPLTKLNSVEDFKKDLREAKAEMSKKESEWRKREIEWNKKEIELKKKEAEWTKKESEWNRKESEYIKREPAAKLSVEQLKKELKDAKAELSKRDSGPKLGTDQLKQKLAQSEALCEELAEENEEIKKEVRDLEQELEELHDNFREDQASEFRGLKRELEGATKNCRVLQFKLRKAEKKCELLEIDRHALEDKVREYQAAVRQDVDRSKFKELEQELGMQRSLASSLHEEVEVLKEALNRAEAEKMAPRSATPVTQSLLPGHFREGLLGKDYEALSHELFDTMEREGDLREQLRFSEEEARTARRKMSALEQENETLVLQIKKLTAIVKTRSASSTAAKSRALKGEEAEEETSEEDLKMQLELQEQELSVVRRKLDDAEREAENLQSEVKYLQEKVINQPLVEVPELPKEKESGGGAYWEHKARQQDYEMRETRRRLIEKDREIERLHAEVEVHRRKAARMMVRSRSLDSDLQVDLKRQLQLVEQEAGMLRQKVSSLEAEGDKLGAENKRMALRLSKKAPPSSAELLQLDNLELKEKMEEQQRKLEALMEKTRADSNPVTVIQDYKPLKESLSSLMSENENDLIGSLKRKLRSKEEEQQALQGKAAQLQAENDRLSREFRRLKESLAERKRPAKAVRESATRIELREIVSELQDEISELQVNLRSREVMQEGLEEEVERARKELREATKELQQKEEKLGIELGAAKIEKEALKKELEAQRSRSVSAEDALKGGVVAGGVEQAKRISTLSQERREAERRATAAEEALALKTQRLREAQEALAAASSLREDLARSNRSLESQKADVEKELEEHRNLLTKAEGRAAELRSQVDKTDRDLTSLRKECNQLRNELEDERGRMKQSSDRKQSEASSGWGREREGLRRIENDLRNRIEHLQHQVTDNEKIWIEKESRMRDDFKKKKDGAVREVREKGEAALELVKEEEKILRGRIQELTDKLEKLEGSLKEATEKSRHLVSQHRRDKEEWQAEKDALEASSRQEQKKRERLEREQEQALATKEEELLRSRERLVAMEREQRRNQMQIEEVDSLQQKVRQLDKEADKARAEYDLITSKYDQLEDEFVKTKASLVADKELIETNLLCLKRDYNELSFELTSLKSTYNARQDNWIKEKLDLQERLKELTRRMERLKLVEQERRRLQDAVEEKEAFVQIFRKEEKQLKDEREKLGKRVEELTKMLVAQKPGAASPAGGDPAAVSRPRKPDELEATRRDYEGRMALMAAEIASMQAQICALATERDDLRAQLSSAERSAEEVRSGSLKRERARHREEADAARRKVHELRFQLEDLREQLEDAQLENRNLRLQIETDKNTFDFLAAELKSKINQLEEQKILESTRGQTRNIAKTRLELAWEKERTELQLLLAESHRLGVELKERVQSGDGDHDRERQAVRKQMLEMRSATEKERQESKRKMTELHSSLLEIRESHAKLRGMYDRMKKERELLLKEREEWRQRLQTAVQLHAKVAELADDFDKVTSQVSDNSGKTPLNIDLKESVQKVKEGFAELQTSAAALKEDERLKRTTSFRRAVSAQEVNRPGDPLGRWQNPQRVTDYPLAPPSMILRPPPRQKALQRKSLSLDQALSQEQRLKIWESEGESACSTPGGGSLLSLGGYGYETDSSLPDSEYRYGGIGQDRRRYRPPSGMTTDSEAMSSREGSVDPGGSVESVPLQLQKRTLKDKLKLLRRTKSIDVASGRKEEPTKSGKVEKEMSLRSKISKVLRMGRTDGQKPALPPRGATPEVVPRRPTAEKPLSASRGDLSAKTTDSASKSADKLAASKSVDKSAASKSADKSAAAKKARETPV